jgi:hypothetical protein
VYYRIIRDSIQLEMTYSTIGIRPKIESYSSGQTVPRQCSQLDTTKNAKPEQNLHLILSIRIAAPHSLSPDQSLDLTGLISACGKLVYASI